MCFNAYMLLHIRCVNRVCLIDETQQSCVCIGFALIFESNNCKPICRCCCRRKEPIIAIGGGVCLDVAGLAANLYRRNTPLIKIPTTVMAAVDASIGIKTAVNFHGRKNKMGTYCAPLAVFIDKTFLKTLGDRHLSNGSAEILKMACIKDRELFELMEQHSAELIQTKFQVGIVCV